MDNYYIIGQNLKGKVFDYMDIVEEWNGGYLDIFLEDSPFNIFVKRE